MTIHILNNRQILSEIEDAIRREKHAMRIGDGDRRTCYLLKAIAADYRARLPEKRIEALTILEAKVGAVKFNPKADAPVRGLGQEVAARWQTIRQALSAFAAREDTPQ